MKGNPPPHPLFIKCLIISMALHSALVFFFFSRPIFFSPVLSIFLGDPLFFKKKETHFFEKEKALEETLNQFVTITPSKAMSLHIPYFPSNLPIEEEFVGHPPLSHLLKHHKSTKHTLTQPRLLASNTPLRDPPPVSAPPQPILGFEDQERELDRLKNSDFGLVKAPEFINLSTHETPHPSPVIDQIEPSFAITPKGYPHNIETDSFHPKKLNAYLNDFKSLDLDLNKGSRALNHSLIHVTDLSVPEGKTESEASPLFSFSEEAPGVSFTDQKIEAKTIEPLFVTPKAYSKRILNNLDLSLDKTAEFNTRSPINFSDPPPLTPPQPLANLPTTLSSNEVLFSQYGIPDFHSLEMSSFFDIEIKSTPRQGGGYLFSLNLIPKQDLTPYRIGHHYYFLIDQSNSIEKHRFQTFKRGVKRALAFLQQGDRFNITIFGSKIIHLSKTSLPYNKKSQQIAEEFLEREDPNNFGSTSNIYTSLKSLIPHPLDDDVAHTAILISDGGSGLKSEKQRRFVNTWLNDNQGKISFYTAAVGTKNNLVTLDLLGTLGRGALLYSDTHTGFPRKLAKLVLGLRTPIAKELWFSINAKDPNANIRLYPPSYRLPYLIGNRPYQLIGTADKLSDFHLVIQGKNRESFLSIKKEISFDQTQKATHFLSKKWNVEKAHSLYEQYLQKGNLSFLEEAKELLKHEPTHSRW